ncbi:thiol reductant ABC exporter subunit CydD [Halomonas sp. TRM85114]|uniref:thiol reductant ABC exporter subunit CydD n=1 Tax=Halomonas jincaotanensis TaxID=2810616 RepID=UPI001BD65824|nr:thiol reductant ABC exporter subunit CydD [Halomonas jincaotanensis]MBS9404107.1 thiol reductant ABC exporter subunit CydD [Halomonas jincaotanensis]
MLRTNDDATDLKPRGWLAELAARERPLLFLASFCGMMAGGFTILQMGLLAWLLSQLLEAKAGLDILWPGFVALVTVVLLRAMAQWTQEAMALEASLRIRRRARAQLLDHLALLGPVRLAGRHSASLANQLVEQVEALDGYVARFLPQMRLAVAVPLMILGVVVWLDWLAATFLLISAPLIPLFMALVGMGAERLNRDQFAAVARLSGHFIDRVRGISTLQLFGRTREATRDVQQAADHYRRLSMRTLRLAFLSSAVLEFFASVAIAVVAIYVGFGLLGYITYGPSTELTLFTGLLVLLLAPEFFQPLRSLSQHYHDRAAALGAAEGMVSLLTMPVDPGRVPGVESPPTPPGVLVSLEAATLTYPGRGTILGPLTLTVRPGDILVVTGASGAGKSSLLQLLAGFVDPSRGRRCVMPGLRFAWMDQRPLLIQGSLADNLRLAAPKVTDEAMRAALERAGLAELLAALPEGLATSLGERGIGLSGGQAQRLALARIFLSSAPLVLLDEPTAHLDADTEAELAVALNELAREGRSLVVATHHPALMRLANQRIDLGDARVKEAAID